MKNHGIFGLDFLEEAQAEIDHGKKQLRLRGVPVKVHDRNGRPFHSKITVIKDVFVAPGQEAIIMARVNNINTDIDDVALMEPSRTLLSKAGVLAAHSVVNPRQGTVPVRVYNPGYETTTLWKGTTVGVLTDVLEMLPFPNSRLTEETTDHETSDSDGPTVHNIQESVTVPEHLQPLYDRDRILLNEQQDHRFRKLLNTYGDQFAKDSNDIGVTPLIKHDIPTGDEAPVRQRVRRLPQE